jgi:hypothetical protein
MWMMAWTVHALKTVLLQNSGFYNGCTTKISGRIAPTMFHFPDIFFSPTIKS